MATFAFKPQYTYKPTPPRSKSTATRRKPAPEGVSILNKLQHMSSSASLSTSRPAADDGGYRPGIRGPGTVYGRSDKGNNENDDDSDSDLPTIEKLLLNKLQEQGFTAEEDQGPDKTGGVEGVASEEREGSVDQSRSAQSDDSGGSPDDPIFLLGDGDLSASAVEADDIGVRIESAELDASLFDSSENAVDSTTPAPPCSSDGWHDIDDFPEPAPRLRLAEQGASTSDSLPPHTPPSLRLSSELLHDSISTEGLCRARSEATTSSSGPPPHHDRASPESQEVEQEQEEDEGNIKDKDEGRQQEMNIAAVTAESASPRPANRRQSLPNLDPSPEPSRNKAGSRCDRDSDDELNSSDSARDDEKEPRPAKRKQPSSSHGSLARKKRRRPLQQSPSRQHRHSPPNQRSRIATSLSAKGRLPSPAPSMPQSVDTTMSLNDSSLSQSSRATLPTLTEITFRPHSAHCYAFTAVVQDGCNGRGVSLAQVVRLIASTGHVGKIDDFTIKPIEQHSYLLSGFSWHASRLSSSGTALSTTAEAGRDHVDATRTRHQEDRALDARALVSQRSKPSSSNYNGGLSDSDPDVSSDYDGCSSEAEKQGGLSVRMNIPWDPVDEQRLVAWKKEGKPWDWIFKKFPGRTHPAIRTRWSMVRSRNE